MATKKSRHITTITVYTYGETPQESFEEGLKMCKMLNEKFDCHADVEKMEASQFGKLETSPIDISLMKRLFGG